MAGVSIVPVEHRYVVTLSDKRIATMVNAKTLGQAQKMGPIDYILDTVFHGGAKKAAIKQAFAVIECHKQLFSTGNSQELLNHLLVLRLAAKDEYIDQVSVTVTVNANEDNPDQSTWGYEIKLPKELKAFEREAAGLPIGNGLTLAAFEDMQRICKLTKKYELNGDDNQNVINLLDQLTDVNLRHCDKTRGEGLRTCAIETEKVIIVAQMLPDFAKEKPIAQTVGILLTGQKGAPSMDKFAPHMTFQLERGVVLSEGAPVRSEEDLGRVWLASAEIVKARASAKTADTPLSLLAQDMIDDEDERKVFEKKLDDTNFNSASFVGFETAPNDKKGYEQFTAVYKNEGEDAVRLLFSNRTPTNRELRGEPLKERLRNETYGSLLEMVATVRGTSLDSSVVQIAGAFKNDVITHVGLMVESLNCGIDPFSHAPIIDDEMLNARKKILASVASALHKCADIVVGKSGTGVQTLLGEFFVNWVPLDGDIKKTDPELWRLCTEAMNSAAESARLQSRPEPSTFLEGRV